MKKILILILICFAQNIFSQTVPKGNSNNTAVPEESIQSDNQNSEDNSIHSTAGLEVRPEFRGGKEALQLFIKENYTTPEKAVGLKGKIYLTFIVEKDGSLSDIKVIRDLGFGTGREAIRVLSISPKWTPGQQNGKLVRVLYSIPINQ
jgi:hypothetical protein